MWIGALSDEELQARREQSYTGLVRKTIKLAPPAGCFSDDPIGPRAKAPRSSTVPLLS